MGFVRCMGYSDADLEPSKTVTSNGTVTPSSGYIGMKQVVVDVSQSTETLTATENGTYTPSEGKVGFSSVTVNVSSGAAGLQVQPLTITDTTTAPSQSSVITFTQNGQLLIESYLNNSSNYLNSKNVTVKLYKNGTSTTLISSCSASTHIGYTGIGSGNIPIQNISAGDQVYLEAKFDNTIDGDTTVVFNMFGFLISNI